MIEAATFHVPLRVSFGGGGTDLAHYFTAFGGRVVGAAIVGGITVTARRKREPQPSDHDDLALALISAAVRRAEIEEPVEVLTSAGLPSGIGLGSSSAFCTALVAAVAALKGREMELTAAAETAYDLEHGVRLGAPGKQDHHLVTHGGVRVIDIERDGTVHSRPIALPGDAQAALEDNVCLYFGGRKRDAALLLNAQAAALAAPGSKGIEHLHRIRQLADEAIAALEHGDIDAWGRLLHEHWISKRSTSTSISRPDIDELYGKLRADGSVLGGKLVGAGGGGVLLLYVPKEHDHVDDVLARAGYHRLRFAVSDAGLTPGNDVAGFDRVVPARP